MHRNTHRSLHGATNIVAIPRHTLGHIGIDTAPEEEATGILNVRILGRDEHNETNQGRNAKSDHKQPSGLQFVGCVTTRNAQETSDDVRRDAHELRFLVAVAEGLDDCW